MAGLDNDFFDVAFVELGHKVAENDLFFRRVRRNAEQIEQENHEQADHDPEKKVLSSGIHPALLVDNKLTSEEIRKLG
jgi:hypothetical protein